MDAAFSSARPARPAVRAPTARARIIVGIYQNRAEICVCLYSPNGGRCWAAGGSHSGRREGPPPAARSTATRGGHRRVLTSRPGSAAAGSADADYRITVIHTLWVFFCGKGIMKTSDTPGLRY